MCRLLHSAGIIVTYRSLCSVRRYPLLLYKLDPPVYLELEQLAVHVKAHLHVPAERHADGDHLVHHGRRPADQHGHAVLAALCGLLAEAAQRGRDVRAAVKTQAALELLVHPGTLQVALAAREVDLAGEHAALAHLGRHEVVREVGARSGLVTVVTTAYHGLDGVAVAHRPDELHALDARPAFSGHLVVQPVDDRPHGRHADAARDQREVRVGARALDVDGHVATRDGWDAQEGELPGLVLELLARVLADAWKLDLDNVAGQCRGRELVTRDNAQALARDDGALGVDPRAVGQAKQHVDEPRHDANERQAGPMDNREHDDHDEEHPVHAHEELEEPAADRAQREEEEHHHGAEGHDAGEGSAALVLFLVVVTRQHVGQAVQPRQRERDDGRDLVVQQSALERDARERQQHRVVANGEGEDHQHGDGRSRARARDVAVFGSDRRDSDEHEAQRQREDQVPQLHVQVGRQ
ncbi:hypothetical protein ON010_g18035 [Phytophthora cinnamomi]|nr:hypothetical protein ON010_g18035 [Phytophthora cinnamomi]